MAWPHGLAADPDRLHDGGGQLSPQRKKKSLDSRRERVTMADSKPAILGGTLLPDVLELSACVSVALGQNPSMFTGPGTNTYLVGTGRKRLLLDTGSGLDAYMPVLEEALARVGCDGLEGIVLTHAHPDHIGGVDQVRAHFGELPVYKRPWPSETGLAGPGGGVSRRRCGHSGPWG